MVEEARFRVKIVCLTNVLIRNYFSGRTGLRFLAIPCPTQSSFLRS